MSKHSAAPFVSRAGASGNQFIYAADRPKSPIAGVCILGEEWEHFEQGPANLALFLAAPELLAALELALDCMDRNVGDCPEDNDKMAHEAARAAIAKARGEQC